MRVEMTYVAFDKGGNPHKFSELPLEKHGAKECGFYPCFYDDKGDFLGPIWYRNERGKSQMMTSLQLSRQRTMRMPFDVESTHYDRNKCQTEVVYWYYDENLQRKPCSIHFIGYTDTVARLGA